MLRFGALLARLRTPTAGVAGSHATAAVEQAGRWTQTLKALSPKSLEPSIRKTLQDEGSQGLLSPEPEAQLTSKSRSGFVRLWRFRLETRQDLEVSAECAARG